MKKFVFALALLTISPILINDAYSALPFEELTRPYMDIFMLAGAAGVGGFVFFMIGKLKSKKVSKPKNDNEITSSDSKISSDTAITVTPQTTQSQEQVSSIQENNSPTLDEYIKPKETPAKLEDAEIPRVENSDQKESLSNDIQLESENKLDSSVPPPSSETEDAKVQTSQDAQNQESTNATSQKENDDTPYVVRSVLNSINPVSKMTNFEAFQVSELNMSIAWLRKLITKKLMENPSSKVKFEQELVKIINDEILLRAEKSGQKTVFDVPTHSVAPEESEKIEQKSSESVPQEPSVVQLPMIDSNVQNEKEVSEPKDAYLGTKTPETVSRIIRLIDTTSESANFVGIVTEDLRISYDWLHDFMSRKLQEDINASVNYETKLMRVINDEITARSMQQIKVQIPLPPVGDSPQEAKTVEEKPELKKLPTILDLIAQANKRKKTHQRASTKPRKSEIVVKNTASMQTPTPKILELIAKSKKAKNSHYRKKSKYKLR